MYKLVHKVETKFWQFKQAFRWYSWRGTTDGDKVASRLGIRSDKLEWMNIQGHNKGYSRCFICKDSLQWKASHYIGFTLACPYCQECHYVETKGRKIRAMYKLAKEWYTTWPEGLWSYRGFGGYVRVFLLSVLGILIGE